MNRSIFKFLLTVGLLGLLVAACVAPTEAPADGEASTDTDAAASEETSGGTIIWAGHQEVAGLSPNDGGPTVQWAMIYNIHDSMLLLDENYELQPALAEAYEASEDGLQYTFTLRDDVTFHDGSPFTAEDVKYTFEFYADAETGSTLANNFQGMGSVETPDEYTVVVNMETPNAAFLVNVATIGVVPSDYHSEVGEDIYRTAPIGTGPFRLVEWVPAEYTLLEANEEYFGGRPPIDFLRQEVIPEPSVRAIALETGEIDSITWPLLVEDSLRLRDSDEGYTFYSTPSNSIKHFPLNNQSPQLSDKRVRQAMLMALDRQRIIDDLWDGAATVADANLTPASSYYNPDVAQYAYDPEGAMALLEEAGWTDADGDGVREKDGMDLSFTCTTITGDQARRPIAELAQQFLAEVGVDMQLEEAPVSAILEGLRSGTLDCSLFNWTYGSAIDPDGSTTLSSDGANNFSSFQNERVDELLDLGLQETNPEVRAQYYAEIQEIVAEEVPFLYLQWDELYDIYSPRVGGLPDPESTINGNRLFIRANIMNLSDGG